MGYHQRVLLRPGVVVERTPPVNVKESDAHLFSHEYRRTLHNVYGYVYHNAFVSGSGSAYYFETMSLRTIPQSRSSELTTYKDFLKSFLHHVYQRTYLRVPKGVIIADENSRGYFHWITDMLPKILAMSSNVLNNAMLLMPEKYFSPILLDMFRLLDIDDAQVLVIPRHKKVLVDALHCVKPLGSPAGSGNYHPDIMQQLRSVMVSHIDDTQYSDLISCYGHVLYISRSDAAYRYMVNEDEIVPILKEHGFSVVVASTLTFIEQAVLFSRARIILGMHGAGLTNMMWLPPHAIVAEIRLEHDSHNNCYFALASALHLKYYYSLATATHQDTHTADFNWAPRDVLHLLQELRDA